MFVMYFSCEDCREERGFTRGHFAEVQDWARGHEGHEVHVNLLGRPGVSVDELLKDEERKARDYERDQKIIKIFTFGLRGETASDRKRKREKLQAKIREILDRQDARGS